MAPAAGAGECTGRNHEMDSSPRAESKGAARGRVGDGKVGWMQTWTKDVRGGWAVAPSASGIRLVA